MHLVLQTLSVWFREHPFRAFTVTKGAFTVTKGAFSLTNFKHETMLTPGVTLPIEGL